MSDSDNAQQEPSMEEILASIRRIISEEGDEEISAAAEEASEEPEEEVLELTDMLEEEPEPEPEPEPVPEPEPEPEPEPIAEDDDLIVMDAEPEPVPEPAIDFEPIPDEIPEEPKFTPPVEDGAPLMEETRVSEASTSFAELARAVAVTEGTSQTLEEIVRSMMKPMLKHWLDQNLPTIVEQLVQKEIDRVTRRGG